MLEELAITIGAIVGARLAATLVRRLTYSQQARAAVRRMENECRWATS